MGRLYEDKKIKVPRFSEAEGFYTTKQRSRMMSKIRGKNTKPEMQFRKALWQAGYRYRVNTKYLIGKPDISIKKYKLVIFIDGEFWHGYQWEEKKLKIKSNRDFWIPKIERNMQRDREVNEALRNQGYRVFRFWSQELKKNFEECFRQVLDYLEEVKVTK
ncbi:MAG: very short patch repair endonuclease [Leeuwenhoekiella sp.]